MSNWFEHTIDCAAAYAALTSKINEHVALASVRNAIVAGISADTDDATAGADADTIMFANLLNFLTTVEAGYFKYSRVLKRSA